MNLFWRQLIREKKKKKIAGTSTVTGDSNVKDNVYTTTIMMSASLIAAFPYDLPQFIPSLLISLIRHMNVSSYHDTVARTVQDFKRTHQDKWDAVFKAYFTSDQLEDLQGAGAAHYFS